MFCLAQHRTLPESLTGTWVADTARVVVRTDRGWMKFNFTPGLADAVLTINADKSATGRIGKARFKKGEVKKKLR